MGKIKAITKEELLSVVGSTGFVRAMISKDFYVTVLLYLLKDIEGIYFKGGTALQKIFLNYSRLSEDADYTVTKDISIVKEEIEKKINESKLFGKISKDKDVDNFLRLVVHYTDVFGEDNTVFIDLNKRARLLLKPEIYEVKHFYLDNIPSFSVQTLNKKELIAEKMAATINRNKPRDHFDMYQIISNKIPIDLELVKQKCKLQGSKLSIIRMFHRANKLKTRWDKDLVPLLANEISFQEVMKTIAKHFKYSEEKKKAKKKLEIKKI